MNEKIIPLRHNLRIKASIGASSDYQRTSPLSPPRRP